MKRVLGLYIPFLSTDRLRRRGREVAVGASGSCGTGFPACLSTDWKVGPTPEAKATAGELVTYADDPPADRRQLEALAAWANGLSPIVHIEGDDTLLLDVTGCARLFGGESNLLDRAIEGLLARGFHARGGMADTSGAAWAIAHAHCERAVIVAPGRLAAYLAPLPVWSLRIDAKTTAALSNVGVETVETLLHLPRSSLASRFGDDLLQRIDQALGDVPEVLTPYRPNPVLKSRFDFGITTTRIDVLLEAIRRALEPFCEKLSRRMAGVCQMFVTFYCPGIAAGSGSPARTVTLETNLSQPTRSAAHLDSLLAVLVEKLKLPAPADALMLWAQHLDPLDAWQDELFATDLRDAQALGDLLDRLATRLGTGSVVRPMPLSDHQPERSFRYVPVVCEQGTSRRRVTGFASCGLSDAEVSVKASATPRGPRPAARAEEERVTPRVSRPLRLSPRPVEIAATALAVEGPPISFRLHGTPHTVVESVGPERIETGWWRGPQVQRDYYRVTTDTGLRCWLFRHRDTGMWFLHGWFD